VSQHRIERPRTCAAIFAALIVLTGATVAQCQVGLGAWHGVGIACAKAMLIVLLFMHVWHSSRVTWVIALAGLR
jgi:cytochrome c oxidase subunit 4